MNEKFCAHRPGGQLTGRWQAKGLLVTVVGSLFALTVSAAEPKAAASPKATIEGTLEVMGVDEHQLLVEKDGMIVALAVDHGTLINGMSTNLLRRIESRLDREFKVGDQVSIRAHLVKDANHALSLERVAATAMVPAPGEEARARAAERTLMEPRKMRVKVLNIQNKDLFVDAGGYAIKLHADDDTLIDGTSTKTARKVAGRLEREFKEGQQVTVEIERYRFENRAISIMK